MKEEYYRLPVAATLVPAEGELVADGELPGAFLAAALEDAATALALHARTESMLVHPAPVVRAVRDTHEEGES